jgi:cytochrome c-type biogenesis protein CcmH/NrfF
MVLNQTDKKEIKDFIDSTTIRQNEERMINLVVQEIKRGESTNNVKDITIKIFGEFYNFMWTQRGYRKPRLKND